jgi:hypothetical protein
MRLTTPAGRSRSMTTGVVGGTEATVQWEASNRCRCRTDTIHTRVMLLPLTGQGAPQLVRRVVCVVVVMMVRRAEEQSRAEVRRTVDSASQCSTSTKCKVSPLRLRAQSSLSSAQLSSTAALLSTSQGSHSTPHGLQHCNHLPHHSSPAYTVASSVVYHTLCISASAVIASMSST